MEMYFTQYSSIFIHNIPYNTFHSPNVPHTHPIHLIMSPFPSTPQYLHSPIYFSLTTIHLSTFSIPPLTTIHLTISHNIFDSSYTPSTPPKEPESFMEMYSSPNNSIFTHNIPYNTFPIYLTLTTIHLPIIIIHFQYLHSPSIPQSTS
jgi:hypothetical protein